MDKKIPDGVVLTAAYALSKEWNLHYPDAVRMAALVLSVGQKHPEWQPVGAKTLSEFMAEQEALHPGIHDKVQAAADELRASLAKQPAAFCICPHQDAREPYHDVACPARLAPSEWPARYMANGPQGTFYTDDLKLADALLRAYDEDDDWTVTETNDINLLPLPSSWDVWIVQKMEDYARANVAHAVAPLQAEIESLRAEAEQHLQQAMSNGHKARAAQAETDNLRTEVEALRELCGMAYQLAGVHNAPEKWLDALSNAAAGRPFSTDGLLPYCPQDVCEDEGCNYGLQFIDDHPQLG